MADEILKRDENHEPVIGLVTDNTSQEIRMGRIDDTTKGLKVMVVGGAGIGTVTSVSITTANGISGTVATATTTPAITLTLGAITPTTVNALTLASQTVGFTIVGGTTSKTLTVPLDASVSGTNTGDNATNTQYSGLDAAKANVAGSLTQFIGNTAWRVFYSNTDGDITELALGADGTFLKSNGATSAPTFAAPAGGGDMILADIQTVTGLKTFDTTKLAVKGSSTGATAFASANASATDYTQTLQARDGIVANLDNVLYVGTTSIALNRASAALTLAGITLTTPDIGVATATSVNKMAITAPATASTLAVADGKTFTVSNTLTLTATDSATLAIGGGGTLGTGAYATIANYAPLANPTFTGTITLADNTRIDLTLPTADTYCTGNTTDSFASGYSSAVGDLVFFGSSGKWLEVDSDAVATCQGLIGIALEAKSDTQAMKVALPGSFVRLDAWNWTVGATLYAGETLGAMQETIPTGADAIIKVIGFAVSADVIFFNPSPDQQSTVA